MPWSKVHFADEADLNAMIDFARSSVRHGAPYGIGVFKAREDLTLYFSPIATKAMAGPGSSLVECARPSDMSVEVVVGPEDEPAWYDRSEEVTVEELEMSVLDVMGYLGPDKSLEEARAEYAARAAKAG
jgi:hypothetical protein